MFQCAKSTWILENIFLFLTNHGDSKLHFNTFDPMVQQWRIQTHVFCWEGANTISFVKKKQQKKQKKKHICANPSILKGLKWPPPPPLPRIRHCSRMPFPREITARNPILYPTMMMSTIEIVPPTHSATTLSASL